jgi:hypothetical protein
MFDLTFDLANFINTVVGAFLGGIISLGVSYYFFSRGKGLETLTHWLSHNISNAIIQEKYPAFFGSPAVKKSPNEAPPKNTDIPRLEVVTFSSPVVSPGNSLEILCRVVDEGWNFPSSSGGLEIVDHHSVRHVVSGIGFGYMYAKVPIPENEGPGRYQLSFEMHDIDKKTNQPLNRFNQTVDFLVA